VTENGESLEYSDIPTTMATARQLQKFNSKRKMDSAVALGMRERLGFGDYWREPSPRIKFTHAHGFQDGDAAEINLSARILQSEA
jgi:hypothetical protein